MKGQDAAGAQMAGKLSEHRDRIWLKLQDVTTNDGVEASFGRHPGRIALEKRDVSSGVRIRSGSRDRHGTPRPIDSNDFTRIADQAGYQERDASSAAADVEYSHPRRNPGLTKELPRNRVHQTCLGAQPIEFAIGVAKRVRRGAPRCTHALLLAVEAPRSGCPSLRLSSM
jgi:hypothetical protein